MNTQAQYDLFHRTPAVSVLDNSGLTAREIQYHRHPDTPDTTDERITRHRYDTRGFLMQSADPRLHDAGLANFTCLTDLAGTVLRTESADAGTSVSLHDVAGRPHLAVTGEGVVCTWQYETTTLPGRPLYMTEQATPDAPVRITERFVYAGNSQAEKDRNLAGLCVRHYDTAGLMQTDSIALTGVPLSVTRRLLKDADNRDSAVDWTGEDPPAWNDRLTTEPYTILTAADATGTVLTTTDAAGHVQRVACDVAGALTGRWLMMKGTQKEQAVVTSLTYSAAGQTLREEHGNGVVTTYSYEPQTQRLTGIKTERPGGHASGAKVLQDLQYRYDPVGNVLRITDDAEETRFWRNQKVVPENTYVYDSLYQLVSATGREMAGIAAQGNGLPSVTAPLPADSNAFTAWTRAYRYDTGGNLTQIQHSAPATGNRYTTEITVSGRSNRAVLNTLAGTPDKVDCLFLAGGHQTQLVPGQHLTWTPRGELSGVTPVTRDGLPSDRETYRYDAGRQRVIKTSVQKTGGSTRTQRTLYLPGLEVRTTKHGNSESEVLQTITLGDVRVLHRVSGKSDAGETDNPIRYSYGNLTGSCGLEVDGEGKVITQEEYYPYGGTAVWTSRSRAEADDKTRRYSGKERDATGLYYYGYRYYQPWAGRWLSADPAGTVDGLNLYRMVRNNPLKYRDHQGLCLDDLHIDTNPRIYFEALVPNANKSGSEIMAQNLTHIQENDYQEKYEIDTAFNSALAVLNNAISNAINNRTATENLVREYIGPPDPMIFSTLVKMWEDTRDVMQAISHDLIKIPRFAKFSSSSIDQQTLAKAIDSEGAIILYDNFFDLPQENKVETLIHEYTHMNDIIDKDVGLEIKGGGAIDFWYLDNNNHSAESAYILERGLAHDSDVNIRNIGKKIRTITNSSMSDHDSFNFLNGNEYARRILSATNPDNIAWAALNVNNNIIEPHNSAEQAKVKLYYH